MGNNKLTWSIVTLIAAGLATYMVIKKRRALRQEPETSRPGERHLTDVFAKAKNHGGGEFVL